MIPGILIKNFDTFIFPLHLIFEKKNTKKLQNYKNQKNIACLSLMSHFKFGVNCMHSFMCLKDLQVILDDFLL